MAPKTKQPVFPEWLVNLVVLVVMTVWVVAFAATLLIPGYAVPVTVHLGFGVVLGAFFGRKVHIPWERGQRKVRESDKPSAND